jgi:hypothetical protein
MGGSSGTEVVNGHAQLLCAATAASEEVTQLERWTGRTRQEERTCCGCRAHCQVQALPVVACQQALQLHLFLQQQ